MNINRDVSWSSFSVWSIYLFTNTPLEVAQWVEHWTCDQQVVGSSPTRGKAA